MVNDEFDSEDDIFEQLFNPQYKEKKETNLKKIKLSRFQIFLHTLIFSFFQQNPENSLCENQLIKEIKKQFNIDNDEFVLIDYEDIISILNFYQNETYSIKFDTRGLFYIKKVAEKCNIPEARPTPILINMEFYLKNCDKELQKLFGIGSRIYQYKFTRTQKMINYFIVSYFHENHFSNLSEELLMKKIRETIPFPPDQFYLFDFNDINEILKQHRFDLPMKITYTNWGKFVITHCHSFASLLPERKQPKYPIFIDDLPVNKKLKKNYLVLS